MALSAQINVSKQGMDRDSHPSSLPNTAYSYALNANYEDNDGGGGAIMLQNEQSNFKCFQFPSFYKVVGFKKDALSDKIYFFLSDGTNSEIGYVDTKKTLVVSTDVDLMCGDCSDNQTLLLDDGIEGDFESKCEVVYTTLLSDACEGCINHIGTKLNFSIDHPIQEGNIIIKEEKCGKVLYWTDNFNPPRFLKLDMLNSYNYIPNLTPNCSNPYQSICSPDIFEEKLPCTNCEGEEDGYAGCIDADALRLFPLYSKPCITPVDIQYGGQLKPGVYEFLVAYCDKIGNEASEYFSITNPITIFEESNKTYGLQGGWDRTNLGIKLTVNNLSTKFLYYKVAVIQRAAIDNVTSYYIEGIHPTYDNSITFYTEADKLPTYLNHLRAVKSNYIRTEMLASNNGYLFHGGLTVEKEMNLQKVVNLMGAFLRWETVVATEDLYESGVNTSKYRGFLRDEVYPFSIRFLTDDNFTSANFLLSNRPKSGYDGAQVPAQSEDYASVNAFSSNCSKNGRNERWQYYNTASEFNSLDINIDTCNPKPYAYGEFGYFESTETYPDNRELFDSSDLKVKASYFTNLGDIDENPLFNSSKEKNYFAANFASGIVGDYYELNDNTNLVCKDNQPQGLRLYRFPDFNISPFMGANNDTPDFGKSTIFPIGVSLDPRIVNIFLDIAVDNNLITGEQRKRITKYEIFRGDRALNKSIIAKGLLYDMYEYEEESLEGQDYRVLYSNYPYNDLGVDDLNRVSKHSNTLIPHPYGGDANGRFTFHSPDTHFYKPALPTELKIEAVQTGKSRGVFTKVKDHSKWVILTERANKLATIAATVEAIVTIIARIGDFLVQDTVIGGVGLVGKAVVVLAHSVNLLPEFNKSRQHWVTIFKDFGKPYNFASYYTSEGWYNNAFRFDSPDSYLRGLTAAKYLAGSRYRINEDGAAASIRINNFKRESTVFLSVMNAENTLYCINYPQMFYSYDDSRFILSENNSGIDISKDADQSPEISKKIASLYASIKNYVPNQYGELSSFKWLPMSHCGNLTQPYTPEVFTPIFGGDIFITRFSFKRKMPLFLEDAVKLTDRLPFEYFIYRNIGYPRFYVDYDVTSTAKANDLFSENAGIIKDRHTLIDIVTDIIEIFITPIQKSTYNLDRVPVLSEREKKWTMYVTPPSTFYLYYYGIPQFLVESEINLNTRYGRLDPKENFYPNVGDFVEWTQEVNVPIATDNYYFYNNAFSKTTTPVNTRMLPDTFDKQLYDCLYDSPNGVAYSMQDNSEQDLTDPWLIYKPLDFYQFKTSSGKLIDLRGIESTQILARFENQMTIFNAIDTIKDRVAPTTTSVEFGTGGIFASRPVEFSLTDLGYAGTQHKALLSNEFGHFWVDAVRGQVFQVNPNGQGLNEITTGLRHWFKEHLPFKILKGGIKNLTERDLDNQFKGLGIVLGWDALHKRVFLTKRDYVVKPGVTGLEYKDGKFLNSSGIEISLADTNYFQDASFTLAYSLMAKSWISYYSFTPDFYINHHNFFQTGINRKLITEVADEEEENKAGVWNHLSHNNSFQVFYGERFPFTIDMSYGGRYKNTRLQAINYWLDTQRKHNDYDFVEHRRIGFNKAWIYNHSQNSGELNLIPAERNNLKQKLDYPKTEGGVSYILATEENKKWSFNYFYNRVKNELNNIPIWKYDINQIEKTINPSALNYHQKWLDRLSGDWFNLRLTQDLESRYKLIFKFSNTIEQ